MMLTCKHHDVRTTVTFDEDVADQLERENHRAHEPMKQTINRVMRVGLANAVPPQKRKRFVVKPLDLGTTPEQWERWKDLSIQEILDEAEEGYLR
jgi:hypothetical protein